MAVKTSTRTSVRANVASRSFTWVSNELVRCITEVVVGRGLSLDYVHQHHDTLFKGFRTWLSLHKLKAAVLEIYDTGTDKLVEKCPFQISYQAEAVNGEEKFHTDIDKLKAALAALPPLRPGCKYRILADLEDNAPDVPGWAPSRYRDDKHLANKDIGTVIDTAACGVQMSYWIERSDNKCA